MIDEPSRTCDEASGWTDACPDWILVPRIVRARNNMPAAKRGQLFIQSQRSDGLRCPHLYIVIYQVEMTLDAINKCTGTQGSTAVRLDLGSLNDIIASREGLQQSDRPRVHECGRATALFKFMLFPRLFAEGSSSRNLCVK
jgi:hypothetical protein